MDTSTPNIWQLQARRDVPGLMDALAYADEGVRKRAATALRTLDAAEALPALEAALAVEEDWQAQASISAAIQYLRRENRLEDLIAQENVEELIAVLHSLDETEVILAARALGQFGDMRASEALIALFRRPDISDDVRYVAAQALIALKSPPAVVSLIAGLRRPEWQVRRNSAAILGQLEATWAAPALADALRDGHPLVRQTAEAALQRFDTPAARDYLNEWRLQQRAIRARQQAAPQPAAPAAPPPAPPTAPPATPALASVTGSAPPTEALPIAEESPASVEEQPAAEAPALGGAGASGDAGAPIPEATRLSQPTALFRPEAAAPDDAPLSPAVEESSTPAPETGDQ